MPLKTIIGKSWQNDKSPANDGLPKEFYVTFWDDIKATFVSSLKQAKERKELSISQRQAIIKLIEKEDRDNTLKIADLFLC